MNRDLRDPQLQRISQRRSPRTSQSGFTVVELMMAMFAGLLVIGSVYFIGAASARHFHEQQRISSTQMSLRMAMEQLRRDISRAGFGGTPNSQREQRCREPAQPLAAIDTFVNDDPVATGWLPNAVENGVTSDRLVLTGNYVSPEEYLAVGLSSAAGDAIRLQRRWQGFRRSFGNLVDANEQAAFTEVFRAGRILHIRTLQGNHFFVTVTGTDPATATIQFTPQIGIGGHCVGGLADGASIAPMSRIEYTITDPTRDGTGEGASLEAVGGAAANDDALGRVNSVLVRRELNFGNDNPIAGTTRMVLEYAADFNIDFIFDQQLNAGAAPNLQRLNGAAAAPVLQNNPERARTAIVSLSARTAEQDPRFPWVAPVAGQPLLRYRVNPQLDGAARVRTLRSEISLPNVASRVLR